MRLEQVGMQEEVGSMLACAVSGGQRACAWARRLRRCQESGDCKHRGPWWGGGRDRDGDGSRWRDQRGERLPCLWPMELMKDVKPGGNLTVEFWKREEKNYLTVYA